MVYFIKANDRIKIGYANDPSKRIQEIQTSSPFYLEVLLIIDGSYSKERELHKKFQEFRKVGEWFELSEPIKEFISSLSEQDRKYEFGFDDKEFDGDQQILNIRRRHKLSLDDCGKRLNISKQGFLHLQQSENEGGISINSMKKIAESLGYTFEYRFVPIAENNQL